MEVKPGRKFMGRFSNKADLLEAITELCKKEEICLGKFSIIGAVTKAKMGYYNQEEQKYVECVDLDKKLEITSCIGNVSFKDGDIFVHAHISLADLKGNCYGGHLMPGTEIFAAEYCVEEFTGQEMHRKFDPETGLSLW